MDKLYDAWAKRNPNWEARFKEPVIERFANYGSGAGESVEMRGKIFGGGYEVFIFGFFPRSLCKSEEKSSRGSFP